MRRPIAAIEPVAVALDQIDAGPRTRFTGIDLETGARISVVVERSEPPSTPAENFICHAQGLLLVLSIETLKAAD
jgi:hypothetical protein